MEDYVFHLDRYMSQKQFERIKKFTKKKKTPFLLIDLDVVKRKYMELASTFENSTIYYAVKANPMNEIILLLNSLGSYFDVASIYELDQLLNLKIDPERISYGNTIKKKDEIKYFFDRGVRLFVTDSEEDLLNIAQQAPGSDVFFRILTEGTGSDWPLSRKFGAHPDVIYNLIIQAKEFGLNPTGISFHVGSQQRDIGQWDDSIARCKYLFDAVKEKGIHLKMINLGGGFPANYREQTNPIQDYAMEIKRYLYEDFKDYLPKIHLEPGRSIAADAGMIISEVVRVSNKSKNSFYRWVFVDIGRFGGLIETLDESIKYPLFFDRKGKSENVIIAGPTCDSMDILYENFKYRIPRTLKEGDRLYIFTAGAYTQTYSSVAFNGFPPLKSYILE